MCVCVCIAYMLIISEYQNRFRAGGGRGRPNFVAGKNIAIVTVQFNLMLSTVP